MSGMERPMSGVDAGRRIDRTLRELIGTHAVLRVAQPIGRVPGGPGLVDPYGVTLAEEAELECLRAIADSGRDGDEQAAIDRLAAALGGRPRQPVSP